MRVFGLVFGGQWYNDYIAVYVPSTSDVSAPLTKQTAEAVVDRTARFLSTLFGGATAQATVGYYVANDGQLVTENVTIVYAYTRRLSRKQRQAVIDYAAQLRDELGQESVAIEVNNRLRFI